MPHPLGLLGFSVLSSFCNVILQDVAKVAESLRRKQTWALIPHEICDMLNYVLCCFHIKILIVNMSTLKFFNCFKWSNSKQATVVIKKTEPSKLIFDSRLSIYIYLTHALSIMAGVLIQTSVAKVRRGHE